MTVTSGKRVKRPKPEKWSFQITVQFIEVPEEKHEAYLAAVRYFASVIKAELEKELTASEAAETVNG